MKGISILGAAFFLCSQSVTQADDTSDVIFRQGFEPSQLPNVTGPDVDLETVLPAYSTGFLTFRATATDEESGVEQVEFYCDGSYKFATDTTGIPYYSASLNSYGIIDGNHSFHVQASDYAGNVSSSTSISTFIDNTAPAAPGSASASANATSRISLSWSAATDTGSGVDFYSVYRDGNFLYSTSALSFQDSNLTAGTRYCYTIKATDNLGHVGPLSTPACATTDDAVVVTQDWIVISGDQADGRFVEISTNDQQDLFGIGFLRGTADLGAGPVTSYVHDYIGPMNSVLVTKHTADGTTAWSKTFGTTGTSSGSALAATQDGGVVIGGTFSMSGFHLGGENLASSSGTDGFIGKLDANGNHMWSFGVNGSRDDRIADVAVDTANDVLAVGTITKQADPGKEFPFGEEFRYPIEYGNGDAFVVKISDAGVPQWLIPIVGGLNETIASAPDGSFIVQGKFWGTNQISISGQIFTNPNPASAAAYVIKFSPSGVVQWLKTFNTGSTNPLTTIEDIAVDSSGDIYVVGSLINTMDVGGISITSHGSSDGFFFKLKERDGRTIFAKSFGSDDYSSVNSISISPSDRAVLGGYFYGELYIDGEPHSSLDSYFDILIIETDLNGYVLESNSYNNSITELVSSVLLDYDNNYMMGGHFSGNLKFTDAMGQVSSAGGDDLFITRFEK
jgi:chitodextrinase